MQKAVFAGFLSVFLVADVFSRRQIVGTALAAVRENTKIYGQFVGDDVGIVPYEMSP